MAELLIFHHAQGLTAGVRAFAERMTQAGHTAHVPDLYEGRTFDSLDEGIAHAPSSEFGGWPSGVPLQIHIMDRDPLASPPEIDLETARELGASLDEATFFAYPGDAHLFADDSLPSFDAGAAAQAEARVLELLARV